MSSSGVKTPTKTTRVEVQFLGERNFPAGVARLPEHLVYDFNELLAKAQSINPAWTHEALFRLIWVRGLDYLRVNLRVRALPSPHSDPRPRLTKKPPPVKVKNPVLPSLTQDKT